MKHINLTPVVSGVGYPPSKKGFNFLQDSYKEILGALAQGIGGFPISGIEAYVLYGCIKTSLGGGNYSYTEGYIYDSVTKETYYFPAVASIHIGTADVLTITTTADPIADPTLFTDGSSHNVHDVRTLVVSDGALNSANINFQDLIFLNVDDTTPKVFKRILNIGDWNMDSTNSVAIAHGLSDFTKIRAVSAIIKDDTNTNMYMFLNSERGASAGDTYIGVNSSNIFLNRAIGGIFDNTTFDSTSYNRGYITIEYIL